MVEKAHKVFIYIHLQVFCVFKDIFRKGAHSSDHPHGDPMFGTSIHLHPAACEDIFCEKVSIFAASFIIGLRVGAESPKIIEV
jgi:hypothetical protein